MSEPRVGYVIGRAESGRHPKQEALNSRRFSGQRDEPGGAKNENARHHRERTRNRAVPVVGASRDGRGRRRRRREGNGSRCNENKRDRSPAARGARRLGPRILSRLVSFFAHAKATAAEAPTAHADETPHAIRAPRKACERLCAGAAHLHATNPARGGGVHHHRHRSRRRLGRGSRSHRPSRRRP